MVAFPVTASFVAYIDESGDEGFTSKSEDWFIMAGVIAPRMTDRSIPKLVRDIKELIGKKPAEDLHFAALDHRRRIAVVNKVAESDLHVISVLVHKPSVKDPEPWKGGRRLYLHMSALIMEVVSNYCIQEYKPGDSGDGSAEVFFAHRQETRVDQIRGKAEAIKKQGSLSGFQIDWSRIRSDQLYLSPYSIRVGLQLADAVCGSFRAGVNIEYTYADDYFVGKLRRRVYSNGSTCVEAGLKLWPPSKTRNVVRNTPQYNWLVAHYGA